MEQLTLVALCVKCGVRPVIPWKGIGRRPLRCEKCSNYKAHAKYNAGRIQDPVEKKRQAARQAVKRAKNTGTITPAPCAICRGEKNIQGHHHDYDQELNVTWVCASCHKAIDQLLEVTPRMKPKRRRELEAWCPPQWDSRAVVLTP